jgi:very-short-patch-repair endonuclease
MKRFFQKIIEWFRYLFVLFSDEEEHHEQKEELSPRQLVELEAQRQTNVPPGTPPADLNLGSQVAPLYRSKALLSYRERALQRALRRANDNEYFLYAKVRMGDFVFLANEPQERKFHNNQIFCKHVDFLFCDKFTLEPLLVVELDDSSHKQQDHLERDKFKDETFTAIGLPFLRLEVQKEYDWQLLKEQIREKISRK